MIRLVRSVFAAETIPVGVLFAVLFGWQAPAFADTEQRIGDWNMLCQDTGQAEQRRCLLSQKIMSGDGKDEVAAVGVYYPKGGETPVMEFRIKPIAVPQNLIQVRIDNHDTLDLPIHDCTPSYCMAPALLEEAFLPLLSKGKSAVISYVVPSGKREGVTMSLKGFGEAYRTLVSRPH